ncbi:MAG: ribosomal protein S18-alanine N-acetyltransferase [Candidatus Acidiferrales bacterium]
MEREIAIRAASLKDIPAILQVQPEAPEAGRWSEEDYVGFMPAEDTLFLLAEASGRVVAFLLGRLAADEMEVLNLAVLPAVRRQGIGRRLLDDALARGRAQGARQCWLELRASNQAALAFYRSLGFEESQRRPRYYRQPEEDALVCVRRLAAAEVSP